MNNRRLIQEEATYQDQGSSDMTERPKTVFLVAKRPPLTDHPFIWRWLARLVYRHINWSPDYGIEYQGVYDNEAAARHAASIPGGFYIELPFNAELPQETTSFGAHDFPLSEASSEYRNRRFPFVAVPAYGLEKLEEMRRRTDALVEEYKQSA